jgi:hypothetical protein
VPRLAQRLVILLFWSMRASWANQISMLPGSILDAALEIRPSFDSYATVDHICDFIEPHWKTKVYGDQVGTGLIPKRLFRKGLSG